MTLHLWSCSGGCHCCCRCCCCCISLLTSCCLATVSTSMIIQIILNFLYVVSLVCFNIKCIFDQITVSAMLVVVLTVVPCPTGTRHHHSTPHSNANKQSLFVCLLFPLSPQCYEIERRMGGRAVGRSDDY